MERPEDNKKSQDALGDQCDSPDLLGRDIPRMGAEDMGPDIKKRAQTKEDKSSKPEPAGDVVEGDPAHMMIPGGDITSGLRIAAGFEHHGADGSFPIRHIVGVELVAVPQPSGLVHELRHIYFLDIASEIVGGFCGHKDFTIPFAGEGGEGALNG